MSFFCTIFARILTILRKIVDSNPKLKSLLYDMRNIGEFESLYEHEKMLADSVRVGTYKKAISKIIKPGDVVLDLGTGTGILSYFAAQNKPEKIYAIDHSGFIEVAKTIARHNNFENIEFVRINSRDFKPNVKFDVIIHEQMGDYLFNENMVENLLDLKKRVLVQGGKILPGKFELYLEPVQLDESFDVPYLWESKMYDIDFSFLKEHSEMLEDFRPDGYEIEWLEAASVKHFLAKPEPILTFDLNEISSEKEIPHRFDITKSLTTKGKMNGFGLYFKAIFDDEISFETSPLAEKTHWGCCLFRHESRICSGRESINFIFSMPELLNINTWSVSVKGFHEKRVE